MPIKIIAIGKKHEPYIIDGLNEFQKRLRKPFDVEWHLLPHSSVEAKAVTEESDRILSQLKPDDYVIALDETGSMLDSLGFSQKLQEQFNWSQRVVIVIGGAFGVTRQLIDRADLVWSLSDLVFPHQLVRLLLIEQIYRAQSIAFGESYHHK